MNARLLENTSPKLAELEALLARANPKLAQNHKPEMPPEYGGVKREKPPAQYDDYLKFFFGHACLNPKNGCWEWFGSATNDGYGRISGWKDQELAHRIVARILGHDISGLHVCHHCDNPSCINPSQAFVAQLLTNSLGWPAFLAITKLAEHLHCFLAEP